MSQAVRQCFALDVLHDQKVSAFLLPNVMESAYVRVVQAGNRSGLALEPLMPLGVVRKMRRKDFDGNGTVESGVFGLVDLTHPPCANEREDLVRAKPGFAL